MFRADLSRAEIVQLRSELSEIINKTEDQVLFVDIGRAEGRNNEVWSFGSPP